MNKTEWEKAYLEFDKANMELSEHEYDYKHGSNKQIREKAERKMGYVKERIHYLFRKYPDVYIMASGGEKSSDQSRTFAMDEFFQNHYIFRDMSRLVELLNEKIRSFESKNNPDDSSNSS